MKMATKSGIPHSQDTPSVHKLLACQILWFTIKKISYYMPVLYFPLYTPVKWLFCTHSSISGYRYRSRFMPFSTGSSFRKRLTLVTLWMRPPLWRNRRQRHSCVNVSRCVKDREQNLKFHQKSWWFNKTGCNISGDGCHDHCFFNTITVSKSCWLYFMITY